MTARRLLRPHVLAGSVAALALCAMPAQSQQATIQPAATEAAMGFSIAAQPLSSAIVKFAAQSGINLVANGALPASVKVSAVQGRYTPQQALSLMLKDTGYAYRRNGERLYTLAAQGGVADAADVEGVTLDTILVEGNGRDGSVSGLVSDLDSVYQTSAAVTTMDAQTLRDRHAGNIDNALRSSAGTFTRKAMSGAGVAVNIRGMEGYGRVNMMIDGARQNIRVMGHGVSGGSTFVDSDLLAGLDMGRGSLGGVAGVGALGGAANFRTIGTDDVILPGNSYGAMSTVKYGNNAYDWSAMAAAGMRVQNIGVMGAFSRRDSGAPMSGVDDNGKRLLNPNMAEDLKSGLAKLELGDGEDHKLLLGGVWYDNISTIRSEPQDYRNQTYTARYDYSPGSDLIDLTVNAFYNDARVRFIEGNYKGQFNRDKGMGVDVTNRSQFALGDDIGVKLTYGGAYYYDDVTTGQAWGTGGPGDGTIGLGSLFTDATFSYGMFDLTAGFHYDSFRLKGDVVKDVSGQLVYESVDRSDSSFNPRMTLAMTPIEGVQLYTTYAKTFRPPTVTETFFPGAHSATPSPTSPNPDLLPETSKGWEFGVNVLEKGLLLEGDALRLKASYFDNDVENYITSGPYSMANMPMLKFVNIPGSTRIRGFELEAGYDTGFFFTGLEYSKTSTDLPYGMWSGDYGVGAVNGLPDYALSVSAGFRVLEEKLTIGGVVRKVGKTKAVKPPFGPDLIDVDGYMLGDAFATYKYSENATFFVNIENITNTAYKPAHYMDTRKLGRGRTVIGGMTLRF
ncbi:TonB-dependent receptor [Aquamicrobium ahrensii]|uniref:Hemoglobin/transferrin/lactoferrin receptor protein n=1 Tax=Aquamicrobium ahrensii TaxID=469551 RepID=A0ABV2KMV7_9HYPH